MLMPLGCSDKVLNLVRSKKCRSRSRGCSADRHHWLAGQPVSVGTAPPSGGVTPTATPTPTQVAAAAPGTPPAGNTPVNTSSAVYPLEPPTPTAAQPQPSQSQFQSQSQSQSQSQFQPPQRAHAHAYAQAHEAQTQRHSSQNPGTAGPPSTVTMVGSRKKLQRAPPVSYQPAQAQPSKTKRSSLPVILPRHHVRPHEADRQPIRWTHPPHDGAPVPAVAAAALYGAAPAAGAPAVKGSVRVPACVATAAAPAPAPAPAPAAAPAVVAPAARPAGDAPVIAAKTNYPKHTSHTRARSASAVVFRPRYDENFLMPVPVLPPASRRRSRMASVAGTSPALFPHNKGVHGVYTPTSPDGRETDRPRSFSTADQSRFPRPARMPPPPPITPGSYAQFDNSPVRPTSSSSNASSASTATRSSFGMRSPASTRTSFESWDSSPRRADYGWQRPAPIKQQRKRAAPGELFAALPGEVLQLITRELRDSHLAPNSISCATCMMRDLCSVATAAKKLLHPARVALYENIQLVGGDSQVQKKRYKISTGSRLILLRRTLRSNDELAAMVRCLKAPAMPPGIGYDDYQNLIASVVMACPNFERLAGPVSHYDHSFNRLFHALSTRTNLKEMNWVVAPPPPPPATRQRLNRSSSSVAAMMSGADLRSPTSPSSPMSPMSPMTPNSPGSFFDLPSHQSAVFLDLHANWSRLKTLSIHCLPGSSLFMHTLVEKASTCMPSLEHVYFSHLPATAFNDSSLLALPALRTLSLSHVTGVTSAGLSSFATRQSAQSLKKLTLKHMELDSLPALARIFLNLTSLHTFSFVQATTPTMPEDEMIWLFPYLAAPSLRMLHWDITNHTDAAHKAETILAKSIRAGGFPALRALRAPNDTEGVFQSLCRPLEKIELPSDKYWGRGLIKLSTNNSQTDTTASKGSDKPTSVDSEGPTRDYTDLHQSRLAAQTRLDNARSTPRFFVNVIDEDGTVLEKYGMAGFMGEIGSPIHYILKPDTGATDDHGGLVDMSDFLGVGAEDVTEREGCTGRWNTGNQIMADKKERERWWHTERGRWRGVTPS